MVEPAARDPAVRDLVLTRPAGQGRAFAGALAARAPGRFRPVLAPILEILPVPGAQVATAGLGGIAFTSANGVRAFAEACPARGLHAWCVGEITAAAAREAGFAATSADGDLGSLVEIVARGHDPATGPVLHVRGRHAAGDLVAALAARGVAATAAELYEQRERELPSAAWDALAAGAVAAVFSPRTARLLAAQAARREADLSRATAVSISPAADAGLDGAGFGHRLVAACPTRAAMIEALAGL